MTTFPLALQSVVLNEVVVLLARIYLKIVSEPIYSRKNVDQEQLSAQNINFLMSVDFEMIL